MKVFTSVVLLCLTLLPVAVQAESIFDTKVDLSCKNIELSNCISILAKQNNLDIVFQPNSSFTNIVFFECKKMAIKDAVDQILKSNLQNSYSMTYDESHSRISVTIFGASQPEKPVETTSSISQDNKTPSQEHAASGSQPSDQPAEDDLRNTNYLDWPTLPPQEPGAKPMTLREFQSLQYDDKNDPTSRNATDNVLPPMQPGGKAMSLKEFQSLQYDDAGNPASRNTTDNVLPPTEPGGKPMNLKEFQGLKYDADGSKGDAKQDGGSIPPTEPGGKPMTLDEFNKLKYDAAP